uniref:Uncharacterized protein n=1 Tax=Yersinia enterocolitica TaxID=630 RepID=B0RKP6_YEREN|nr:hypothetical protein [Yersinia enterocolitica]
MCFHYPVRYLPITGLRGYFYLFLSRIYWPFCLNLPHTLLIILAPLGLKAQNSAARYHAYAQ